MTITLNPQFASRPTAIPTAGVRFGATEGPEKGSAGTAKPDETATAKKPEPGFFERLEAAANRIKEFVDLFSETLNMAKRGIQDAVKVVKNLPKWEQLLKDADPEGKNTPVERLKSVLDVTMAEFRAGYTGAEEGGEDLANFALYSGVLKRFPGLAAMADNALAKTVLDGALASNPFRPADEARTALEELVTDPGSDKVSLSAAQIEDALGVPLDVTN